MMKINIDLITSALWIAISFMHSFPFDLRSLTLWGATAVIILWCLRIQEEDLWTFTIG